MELSFSTLILVLVSFYLLKALNVLNVGRSFFVLKKVEECSMVWSHADVHSSLQTFISALLIRNVTMITRARL